MMRSVVMTAAMMTAGALALAGCSPGAPTASTETPAPKTAAAPAAPALPAAPLRPEGADAVDAALKAAQDYGAAATAELAGIDKAQARIRTLAGQASAAAARGDARGVTSARAEAEKVRKGLAEGLSALRTSAASQTTALEAALTLCGTTPELAAYEGCAALSAEQASMTATIEALGKSYQAAETAWGPERARLEEASAAVALGSLR
ncbi:MAG: hypothetical protein JNK30_19495 [Phenylobacterium sp.]|uniref:hypothetical protein n=1 Tax=Phenylobacterium sp. TaxID=1871053 RepID=UPI001A4D32EB|nr:hypothetical protein [Phenylobacterium sp.]MBL8773579.1 hypothetical protein [Phenylobacterium sp.]